MDALLRRTHAPDVDRLVAGAVVHVEGRVLVARRASGDDFLPGIEELPSGGCEADETLGECLDRELGEEIGWSGPVRLDPGFVAEFDYLSGSGARTRQYTFAVPLGAQVVRLSAEHTGWRWLGRDDLGDSDLTTETRQVLEEWWSHRDAADGADGTGG